jgi:superfamily II DNA/RNA helicase
MSFQNLGLSDTLLKAVDEAGYNEPTPIQEKAIPYILMNRDVLGCAQTGTGKTAGFTLPMIEILAQGRPKARMPRSLIIEPTRELAAQVSESFEKYGKYNKLSMALLIGGESFADQEKALDRGVDVLIATPGRLLDLFERGKILLADVKILVIDEADRMLDMGFIPDVEKIVSKLPTIRQTLFFSATMPKEIRRLADRFLMNPKEISVTPPASAAETVAQSLVKTSERDKRETLRKIIGQETVKSAIIFCNRKRDVDILNKSMKRHGFNAEALHGDMVQSVRMETLERFRKGDISFLVCSDVAARGLDIPEVSHVFNFDVPINSEDYIHRIGRTGRAGRSGKSFTLATRADAKYVDAIEKMVGRSIPLVDTDAVATTPAGKEAAPIADDKAAAKTKSRRRRSKKSDQVASTETASAGEAEADAKPKVSAKPAPANSNDRGRDAKSSARGSGKSRKPKREEHEERGPRRPVTKPFGEDTPAFLLRPVKAVANA